jgi:hypothetical protein
MKEDKLIISVTTMIALISLNYHIWINEIKALIEKSMMWQYVDSDIDLFVSKRSESSSSSDYMIVEEGADASRSAISKKKLTLEQQKKYKADCSEYSMLDRHHERITQRLRTVQNAIAHISKTVYTFKWICLAVAKDNSDARCSLQVKSVENNRANSWTVTKIENSLCQE